MGLGFVLILLAMLQVKHMFADFYLQTPLMLSNRSAFLHPGRALHCAIHAVGTLIVLAVFGIPIGLCIWVAIAEFAVHFLIDFGKGVWSERAGHSPADASYWRAFGVDQTLHQLTYVIIVFAIL